MSTAQSPAFVAAVRTYCRAFEGGIRDMRTLGPLFARVDKAFDWQPGPAHAPLTPAEKADTVATWQQLDAAHEGQITKLADHLLGMEPAERARSIELWIAVMAAMRDTENTVENTDGIIEILRQLDDGRE